MKTIATFDIGTTAVKGVLVDMAGNPVCSQSIAVDTFHRGDQGAYMEQNPRQWYDVFCQISRRFIKECPPEDIVGIVMSGQMQDLILLDEAGEPVMDAILYCDGRAEEEAQSIAAHIGMEELVQSTANMFEGSRPFAKLLWVKKHLPQVYRAARHVLISSKDYVVSKLTGTFVSDVTSCATAGLMDIEQKCWRTDWLEAMEVTDPAWPKLCYAEDQVGQVLPKAAEQSGYLPGTPVYAGTGDAGSTTLAGGIAQDGEFNINLGTSGWVACTARKPLRIEGVSNLAAMPKGIYINVVPFFNAGNVHKWITNLLIPDGQQQEKYAQMNEMLAESQPGSGGMLFLPYLVGERFPVMDTDIAGCFVDVRPDIGRKEMARAALEGVAYSIRQGVDAIGKKPRTYSLVGGGARSRVWCQILADMLQMPIQVYQDAEFLPSMAIAASVLIARGELADYRGFTAVLSSRKGSVVYQPNPSASAIYDKHYQRYCSIYPAVKGMKHTL